ncbi:MAG: cation:proton antiporter [Prevotella sp.]|nr:cation:proton antiporter [Prevotella sp.]
MSELSPLIKDLALILMVAGVVTLVFRRLKQPLVLGYIMAGFLVSPHMPYTASVVDLDDIHTWADIGVMFLLFSLGLDFSFKKIMKMGASPVITTCSIVFAMMTLGICVGHAFGWKSMDSLFLGGMLAMSSTTIIYKAFDDLGLRQQQFAQMVMSVLILEDILAIVMMVMLSAIAQGSADGGQMLGAVVKIVFFLVLWFVVGIFAIPLLLKGVRRLMNQEVLLIVALGLCCAMAVFSSEVGFSSAFGAFVMGSILAETLEAEKIERLVEPVKNLFGAIFFVSVGMLVDPQILADYAVPIVLLVLTILAGQATLGSASFMLGGEGLKSAVRCGFSMAQIGEFSFIIASLGLSLGVVSDFLYPVVVAVSVTTTFLTPYMIRAAVPAYGLLERRLPSRLVGQLNRMATSRHDASNSGLWHRLLVPMAMNTLIYSTLSSATVFLMFVFVLPLVSSLPMMEGRWWANAIVGVATVVLIAPFLRAMMIKKNKSPEWRQLWAESPRNHLPLLFTVMVRMVIALSYVFYVIDRLFHFSLAVMLTAGIVLIVLMIRSRYVKSNSILLERMFKQNLNAHEIEEQLHGARRPLFERRLLDRNVHIADFDVPDASLWAGQTLKQLRLGQRYGVHVCSILRGGRRLNIPDGDTRVYPGDRLQMIGNDEQLARLHAALGREVAPEDPAAAADRLMQLMSVSLPEGHPFVGHTMQEAGIRDSYGCMVVGMEEGKEQLSQVSPQYRFRAGDVVWLVGEQPNLDRLKQH